VNNRTATRWARNPLLAALLLITVCSRVLVPAGYMPGHGGLIVCPGYLPIVSAAADRDMSSMRGMHMADMDMFAMDMPNQPDQPMAPGKSNKHTGQTLCPFAAAATTMAATGLCALLLIAHSVPALADFPPDRWIPRSAFVPSRLPRGPPFPA